MKKAEILIRFLLDRYVMCLMISVYLTVHIVHMALAYNEVYWVNVVILILAITYVVTEPDPPKAKGEKKG
jgi:hypothetical protein